MSTSISSLGTAATPVAADPTQQRPAVAEKSAVATQTREAVQQAEKKREPNKKELNVAVESLQRKADAVNASVRFRMDQDAGQTVITVLNTKNDEVIRQIPNEEALAMSKAIRQQEGLLINTKA